MLFFLAVDYDHHTPIKAMVPHLKSYIVQYYYCDATNFISF